MTCPKCESDDWKSASFVYKSGTSNINLHTSTMGAGVGVGTGGVGVGGGLASSNSSGTHQSRLSFEVTPPVEPQDIAGTGFWIVAIIFAMIVGSKAGNVTGWIIIISAAFWYFSSLASKYAAEFSEKKKEYDRALARWEATRVCQRCGQLYFP